jgi:hypothetical protein
MKFRRARQPSAPVAARAHGEVELSTRVLRAPGRGVAIAAERARSGRLSGSSHHAPCRPRPPLPTTSARRRGGSISCRCSDAQPTVPWLRIRPRSGSLLPRRQRRDAGRVMIAADCALVQFFANQAGATAPPNLQAIRPSATRSDGSSRPSLAAPSTRIAASSRPLPCNCCSWTQHRLFSLVPPATLCST